MAAGLEDLERRLCDLVRRGLASAQGEPPAFWEEIAKRMVDAQAGGLAGAVREMASLPASGPGWQERLLDRMARCYLLLQGHRHLEALPPETQADIRSLIGWTQSQEELLAQPGVRDRWTVLGQYIEEDERLRVQRIWLCGRDSGMAALLLNFVIPGQTFDTTLPTGAALDASLVFYPGGYPLRALMKERHSPIAPRDAMPGYPSVVAAVDAYAAALARSPWLDRFPMAFHQVVPLCQGDRWLLRDDDGRLLPLAPRFSSGWNLLAVSGGYPVALFGEWNGEHLHPLSACANGVFHAL